MRRLTVLGSCGAYPEPGRACSGYLLEWDGLRLVLDLGYATLPRLLMHCPDSAIDAVIITHEHPDHCIDLHALFRIRFYGSARDRKLPLYCPPGVLSRLEGLEPDTDLETVFDVHELPGRYSIGPFGLHAISLPHHVPNVGVRLESAAGTVAYTGDTGPHPNLEALGRDADLYIVDATDRPGELEQPIRNLLTPLEAAQYAARAGARRLMLTHFWPGNDRAAAVAAARSAFAGEVLAADEGLVVALGAAPGQ